MQVNNRKQGRVTRNDANKLKAQANEAKLNLQGSGRGHGKVRDDLTINKMLKS